MGILHIIASAFSKLNHWRVANKQTLEMTLRFAVATNAIAQRLVHCS